MKAWFKTELGVMYQGDVLEVLRTLPDVSVDCIVTSPPYWGLRDYGVEGQIGLESTLDEYLNKMLQVTAELKRVLKKTGVFFLNWGDCYGGGGAGTWKNLPEVINSKEVYHLPYGSNPRRRNNLDVKPKCMALQNYRAVIRMIDEQGWILRNVIIWHKPNHMPSSVKDRFTNAYEPVFMLVKNKRYWFDLDAVRVPHKTKPTYKVVGAKNSAVQQSQGGISPQHTLGKNPGDLWTISTQPFSEAHFATFPEKLVEPMIKAGCPQWICKKCGKARERITESKFTKLADAQPPKIGDGKRNPLQRTDLPANRGFTMHYAIGWTDCGCNAGWEAGIVLDPFMGSGTTAVVAERLGRRWIGIELNPEYCEIAKERLKNTFGELFVKEACNG